MNKRGWIRKCLLALLVSVLTLTSPLSAYAQEILPPPEVREGEGTSENDILVFEPQLYWEFPFAQGFKISFNFGISFEVPRLLNLVEDDVFNFFLRFRSYVIPAEHEAPVVPITPEVTPTPDMELAPEIE